MEIWKEIPGYSKYQASNLGRIRHKKHKKIRVPGFYNGYARYRIADDSGCQQTVKGHRIVFLAFNGTIDDGMHIDHINRIRHDNRIENLRQLTPEQNAWNKYCVDSSKRLNFIKEVIALHESGMSAIDIHKQTKKGTR